MSRKLFVSIITTIVVLSQCNMSMAQYNADELPALPSFGRMPTVLIDCPTAGTLRRATFDIVMRTYPNGGVLAGTNIGLSNRFTIGLSYGSEGIIAEEPPNWNPRVEFNVKLSLVDESLLLPAASIGFCSQGFGSYVKQGPDTTYESDKGRYSFKSKGFYAVASKNYPFYNWQVGLHGGINYSMEQVDDKNMDFFIGLDSRLNRDVGIVAEYDFGLNDDADNSLGGGRGYLNAAIQWLYSDNLVLEVLLKNLTNNRSKNQNSEGKGIEDIWRGFRVTYIESF